MFSRRLCVFAVIFVFSFACGSPPTDVRTIIPSDALVYLETRDLGRTVGAVVNDPKIKEAAASVPDVGLLEGMEMAIAVTGFETTEQPITQESSVLNFQPRFVAVIETRLWNFQVVGFVEEKLGLFISEAYGGEATLETSDKHGGKYFVWSGQDGRKAFALVIGSLIFFGNDESAIERCLAVKSGETKSIVKNPKLTSGDRLAFGYVSPDGVAQIANITALTLAKRSSEEGEVQSFVARVLPELLRNAVKELVWTATATENGIEDSYSISLEPELARVFSETIVISGAKADERTAAALPTAAESITRYDLRDPQIAWRSILLSAPKLTDQASGNILIAFSSSLFEPYGIDDPEAFLSSIGPIIHTVRFDELGEKVFVVATIKDAAKLKTSLAKELDLARVPERIGEAETWLSQDSDVRAIISGEILVLGDPEGALEFVRRMTAAESAMNTAPYFQLFTGSNAVSVTLGTDRTVAGKIADVISEKKAENVAVSSHYLIETRFNQKGIDRRTVSDFGFIGTIISQFAQDQ